METGLFLGVLAWLASMFSWWHMPTWAKRWSLNHFVITDMVMAGLTYYTMAQFSKSIASMVATVVAGMLMNFTMMALGTNMMREYLGLENPVHVPLRTRINNRIGRK